MKLLRVCWLFALAVMTVGPVQAQSALWSQRMADSTMRRWPDGRWAAPGASWHWNYELGTLLEGMDAVWYGSAKGRVLPVFETVGGSICRAGRIDPDLPCGRGSAGQHSDGTAAVAALPGDAERALLQGGEAVAGATGAAAEDGVGGILAQEDLSEPDVAGRAVHGRAVLCGVGGGV